MNKALEQLKRETKDDTRLFDCIKELYEHYIIKIFTTRNKILTVKWLMKYHLDKYIKDVTSIKEPAWLHIDDRCINFCGNYNEVTEKVANFSTWYN